MAFAIELPPPFQERARRRHPLALVVLGAAISLAAGFVLAIL